MMLYAKNNYCRYGNGGNDYFFYDRRILIKTALDFKLQNQVLFFFKFNYVADFTFKDIAKSIKSFCAYCFAFFIL